MSINDKIKQVLTIKNLSPSYLADDIGVQRSSISHILSGRNRPSLDIIQKIVRRFPEFSYEWFLEEDSSFPPSGLLSSNNAAANWPATHSAQLADPAGVPSTNTLRQQPHRANAVAQNEKNGTNIPKNNPALKPAIDRILIFYSDGTFREYLPAAVGNL
ncbi:helix-turn-helix transcriptional regulator [Fibrella arboris]|uniref:helix-turn-helix transcriptional regulator n=1 Tax=Fibrella arboris TaxID=3242486 RepID=UPI003521A707